MSEECGTCLSVATESNALNLEGICGECIGFEIPLKESREAELSSLLKSSPGKKLDVLVALSGGKDSIYLLNHLSRVQGQRVYALTWNHGHNRDVVWSNIDAVLQNICNVDWGSFAYRHDYMTMVRRALLLEIKNLCMCAHFVNLKAIETSVYEEIPFIAFGFSPAQTSKRGSFKVLEPEKRQDAFKEYVAAFEQLVYYCLKERFPGKAETVSSYLFGPVKAALRDSSFFPAFLDVSAYIPWDISAVRKISSELGWKSDASQQGDLHTNCIFEPMRGYIEYLTGKKLLLSEVNYMIRAGELTKIQALTQLHESGFGYKAPSNAEYFFRFTGLPEKTFYLELSKPISPEARELLVGFVRAGNKVRGYEDPTVKIS